jgi:hypothetical protein
MTPLTGSFSFLQSQLSSSHMPFMEAFFEKKAKRKSARASNYKKKKTICARNTKKTNPQVSFRKKFTGRRCMSTERFFLSNAKQCVMSLGAFIYSALL